MSSVEVTFPIEHVGLYALGAQDGTTFPAVFDDVALVASPGEDVVPDGPFTLRAPGDAPYLTTDADDAIVVAASSGPGDAFVLEATEVAGGRDARGRRPVRRRAGRRPPRAGLTSPTGAPAHGGGRRQAAPHARPTARRRSGIVDGALVLGDPGDAAGFVLEPFTLGEGTTIEIDGDGTDAEISDRLYGIFYEDINYAADGGLYAELVRNRSFEFNTSDNGSFTGLTAWDVLDRSGAGTTVTVVDDAGRLNATNRNRAVLVAAAAGDGLRNASYNTGVAVKDGASYDASVWVRTTTPQTLTLRRRERRRTTVASGTVDVDGSDVWKKYAVTLTASATTDAGRFVVLAGAASTLHLDLVSLFPQDTWVGPVNGKSRAAQGPRREDRGARPAFLRFPGGCVTNVGTFRTYEESGYTDRRRTYQWKETIGPVEERADQLELLGLQPVVRHRLPGVLRARRGPRRHPAAGAVGRRQRLRQHHPGDDRPAQIERWVQDTLDLIEFATGDVVDRRGAPSAPRWVTRSRSSCRTSGSATRRTRRRSRRTSRSSATRSWRAYPDIKIISNSGPDDTGARFDALWEFNREQDVDLVDEHYYNDPMVPDQHRAVRLLRPRGSARVPRRVRLARQHVWNGLTEAAYMTGLERNGDLVELASYAPLLANESYVQWSPDAIWFDNDESWSSANY